MWFFPIDDETLKYLKFSGRNQSVVKIVSNTQNPKVYGLVMILNFQILLTLDMSTIVPTISGPKRPQDKVLLTDASKNFKKVFTQSTDRKDFQFRKFLTQISK